MIRPSRHSPLVALALLACVLANLFACGLSHGQAAAWRLSGLDDRFCSAEARSARDSGDPLHKAVAHATPSITCPMGAALGFLVPALFLLARWLRPARAPRLARERRGKAPPRYCWPSANPRASPLPAF